MSYGKVHDAYWESETIDALSDRAALLGLFLISGPHRNAIGCFKLGMGAITDNPRFGGWGIDGVSDALQELSGRGFIARDDRTGWTFIRNALKHDPIKGLKAAIHAAKLVGAVPKTLSFYAELCAKVAEQIEAEKGGKDVAGYPFDAPSIAKPSPEPSPLPSPEPTPSQATPAPSSLAREFEDWWKVYPKKDDKGHALKAFEKTRKSGIPLETLLAGAKRYRDDPKRDPKFTKNAATWLTGQCWLDEGAEAPPAPVEISLEQKEANRLETLAWAIDKGMINIANNGKPADVRTLVQRGRVTQQQCEKMGLRHCFESATA